MTASSRTSFILVGVAECTIDSDAALGFANQTDETVWVGFNGSAPDGFRIPERLWTEAEPQLEFDAAPPTEGPVQEQTVGSLSAALG